MNMMRRALFSLCLIGLLTLLVVRLVDLQIVRGQTYLDLSDQNRFYTLPIESMRGVFLDRYDDPLVFNTKKFFHIEQPDALFSTHQPITREEALALMATDSAQVSVSYNRSYPYVAPLAHVLGYVAEVTADDLKKDASLPLHKQIGKSGLELTLESSLRGLDGQEVYEINALGERQRLVQRVEPQSGKNSITTIDPNLSQVAFQALGEKKGVVIVSDARNGEVLSLVSKPAFDPNQLSVTQDDVVAEAERRRKVSTWFQDEQKPFFNRAVGGAYPPGSVFKIITALAGLENNKITADTKVIDEGVLKVGDYEYKSWYYWNYGRIEGELDLVRAITRSNDIFFYKVAEWTGPDSIAAMARLFGFGQETGIELSSQNKGLVPDPAWKEQTLREKWYLGNTYHYGIGQGDILVSPVQINEMVQAVANQGTWCRPTLLAQQADRCHEIGVKEENQELVLRGMIGACSPGGTAFPFFEHNEGLSPTDSVESLFQMGAVACKTGTAEFGAANDSGRRATHGWFVAIVEPKVVEASTANETKTTITGIDRAKWAEKVKEKGFPERIVITVLVESDEQQPYPEGSADAAPIAKMILDWIEGK